MSIVVRRPVHHFSPSREKRWRLRIILFLLLLASAIIQGAAGSVVFFSFRPDLVLIVAVYWALNKGPAGGWLIGMAGGFMTDIFSSGMLGLHTLALAIIGMLVSYSSSPLYRTHLSTRVVMVGMASIIYNVLYYLLLIVFSTPPQWDYAWKTVLVPAAWQTILISPLWLWLTDIILRWGDNTLFREKGR